MSRRIYRRGCDSTKTNREICFQVSLLAVEPTIALHKVKNLRIEQKELERSARDGESPVCQESQTLYLYEYFFSAPRCVVETLLVSSRSGHEKP